MPITDPVNNIYMNNMHVTGSNAVNSSGGINNSGINANSSAAASGQAGQTNNLTSSFTQMLSSMMSMNAASTIGNFSDTASGSNYMDGMSGLGGSSSLLGLGGLGGGSDSSMMMMLLMLLLASQNDNGQNNSLLSTLAGNTSTNATTQNNMYMNNNTVPCQHMAGTYAASGSAGIPTNSWLASNASVTNLPGQRNAATYRAVIDQFNVEANERYRVNKNGQGDTYCNIFTWDVTRAMGAEVPHFIETSTGRPVSTSGANTTELNANNVNDWMNTYGPSYGWTKVSPQEAQYYANMGMPAITSWKNPSGHGHLQVVCPSQDGQYNAERGVTIAQAGRQLKNYDYIDTVYGANTLGQVEYFAHI